MKIGRPFIILVGVLILGIAGAAFWLDHRDPLTSLPQPDHQLQADRANREPRSRRLLQHIVLHSARLGDIGIVVSLPDPLPGKRLPILIVLGGLGTGENNIRNLPDAGDNAIIGYDWPMPVRFYSGPAFLMQIPNLYSRLMAIPAQVTSVIGWLTAQPWADSRRVSLLAFSLGALAAPAIQDVAERDGCTIGWTILAYGGAPFGVMVAANPHVRPGWTRPILGAGLDLLPQPLQPTRHLAHLSGQFLVLEGHDDSLIPEVARTRLREAVPEPKAVIAFNGDHMGVGRDRTALLQEIIDASKAWLIEKGAVDPL